MYQKLLATSIQQSLYVPCPLDEEISCIIYTFFFFLLQVACTRRDFLLYALSVGVPEDDLQWLYELGKPIDALYQRCDKDANQFIRYRLWTITHLSPLPLIEGR